LLVWAMFEPIAAPAVDVSLPLSQPFQAVPIADAAPASADVGTAAGTLRASLVSATRAGGELKVRIKIANPQRWTGGAAAIKYADAYVLDPVNRKKYALLKDQDGHFQAEPVSDANEGGRFFLSQVRPGAQTFMTLTFNAPPDAVKTADVVIPLLEPFENVDLAGLGHAADSGSAVAGRTIGLDKALEDLHADVTPDTVTVNLSADVLFDFDKSDLKPGAAAQLADVATVMKAYPGATMQIDGHTDAKGNDAYNQTLSEKRAGAVADWLTANGGIAAAQIRTRGFGRTKPIAPNANPDGSDNPDGRAKNRRVEIRIAKTGQSGSAASRETAATAAPPPREPSTPAAGGTSPGARFPLAVGTRWTFHERQEIGPDAHFSEEDAARAHGNVVESTVISVVKGTDRLDGSDYVRIESTRAGQPYLIEWYRVAPEGLLLGKRNDIAGQLEIPMRPPQRLLSAALRPGESWSWQNDDHAYAVRRRVVRGGSVTVPAGTYTAARLEGDVTAQQGPLTIQAQEVWWFVPDVGFVLREDTMSASGDFFMHITTSLEKFEPAEGR
ncbi:MAG: OmpA family protein, partial [Vicinamibacterales bacterium]